MISIFINTWKALSPAEKRGFTSLVLSGITISLLDIFFLAALLWIVQFYMGGNVIYDNFFPRWLMNRDSIWLIGIFFMAFLVKSFAAVFLVSRENRFNSRVGVRLAHDKLKSFQHGAVDEFISRDSSVHFRNIHFHPLEFCQYLLTGLQQIIMQGTLIIMVIAAIMVFNAPLFFLLLAVLIPPVVILYYFIRKKLAYATKQLKNHNEISFQYLSEALKAYVEGNIYQANGFFLNRFIQARKTLSKFLSRSLYLQSIPSRMIETAAILGLMLLIMFTKQFSISGSLMLSIGAFTAAAYKIIPGMVKLVNLVSQVRAHAYLAEPFNNHAPPVTGSSEINSIQKITVEDLSFYYDGKAVLSGFNLKVKAGSFVGITGGSGRGKTTFFNLLLGFYAPQAGSIKFNNICKDTFALKSLWPSVAYVRQQSFLLNDSLEKNISLEEQVKNKKKFKQACALAGLGGMIEGNSLGTGMQITENGKNISGGQRQRIAIARALYKDAPVILLDEPCSELDEISEFQIMQHFKELAEQGRIIIMITHSKKALQFCHQIVSLDEGERQSTGYSYARVPGI